MARRIRIPLLFAFLLAASLSWAAPWDKSERLKKMADAYDRTSPETVEGTVLKKYEVKPKNSPNYGIHLILKAEKETVNVHLGPVWYLAGVANRIAAGDVVKVIGAKSKEPIAFEGVSYRSIRAARVGKSDGLLFQLRDDYGKPLWSGL